MPLAARSSRRVPLLNHRFVSHKVKLPRWINAALYSAQLPDTIGLFGCLGVGHQLRLVRPKTFDMGATTDSCNNTPRRYKLPPRPEESLPGQRRSSTSTYQLSM
jgi:hypothetical protein